ncbi:MAG: bifunctional diguanylate cyclase/phosphodiesterase [Solobacterium sp.]|jgi:EAL domain-containing protein (putative c-di-GMP-specific phosphodiesterase class I)/GGDEF domain-containing protein|nr:bifunctional diguanylate cyclase/phosphodiesterase [Solobacterium sp.]MCH4050200.1 bifunctional diguanylate cyclase/phosphodiesterase [Solobacterium sp.]MCH4073941.1 bifunctional diguanylate cyclase/phosphodiesterase [Solobacterium sp.]MCI1313467.1 bifunctional diguanylate cyclase/phosphodiesterase [Solobacterium sp.]MCI1345767.1 bifunctional diguanylate cyclase/phosphodiesterase [Solobacterium sp.]
MAFAVYQAVDGKAVTVLVSDGFCAMCNDTRKHLMSALDQSMFERVDPRDAGMLAQLGREFTEHRKPYDIVYRSSDETGVMKPVHTVGYWQTMMDGTELAFLFYTNLTESIELIKETTGQYFDKKEDHFYTDPLTKLPNLNFLYEFGDEKINAIRLDGKQPVLIHFDVSAMESYNSLYGYAAGNDLLCLIAEVLKDNYPNTLITRGYDDHFQVITEKKACADSIQKVNQEIIRRARGNTSGIKAGVCILTKDDTVITALNHARDAYKTIGFDVSQNMAVYSREIEDEYFQQRYIVDHFEQALKEHWIRVFYQGIVDSEQGKIPHGEALARWIDPNQGMISPSRFIPVLRKYHLTYKLDLYMVEQVCQEYQERKKKGYALVPVSVNLSAQDFDHADIFQEVADLLQKYDIPADKIVIEITEEDLAKSENTFARQLDLFRNQGYAIWCDDFGSGYSSLNVFARYRCDLIKLDQGLMKDLSEPNKIIIKAIVETAKKLGIGTLCEGVETEEQYQFAKDAGIDLIQGFYFYKPTPLAMVEYERSLHPEMNLYADILADHM